MSHKYLLSFGLFALGAGQTVIACSPEFRTCEVTYVCPVGGASGRGGEAGVDTDGGEAGSLEGGTAGAGDSGSGPGGTLPVGDAGNVNGGAGGADSPSNGGTAGSGGAGSKAGAGGNPAIGGTAGVEGFAGKGGLGGVAGTAGMPPLLADGAVCTANSECLSNSCGGRCCPANKPCSCPQPTAQNLINNPGFDTNTSGWSVTSSIGVGSLRWLQVDINGEDVTSCPYSGFGRMESTGIATISQCVAVSGSKSYNVSTAVSNAGGGQIDCTLDWFTGANCTGSSPVLPDGTLTRHWLNFDWWDGHWVGGPWFPPTGATSARLSCSDTCDANDGAGPCYANIDKMGVIEAPATY